MKKDLIFMVEVKSFLDFLKRHRQLSIHTINGYQQDLLALKKFIGTDDLYKLKTHKIREFVSQMSLNGLASRSIGRRLTAWRSFFSFLKIDPNPCANVKAPRGKKKLPSALSVDQTVSLLEGGTTDSLSVRDHAMFELMYSSGLRLSELVNIEIVDININDRTITVLGKGNKTRIIPIGKAAISALKQWLKVRATIKNADNKSLFLSSRGTKISARTVQRRLQLLASQKQLDVPVNPHMLRHSFASHVLQSSGDLRAVQELLGHESIKSTQIYSHLDWDHLARVYDASHPRAKKNGG